MGFAACQLSCSSDSSPSATPVDGGSDGAIDCSKVGCAAPPPCGELCKEPCGCCVDPSCGDGGVDASDAFGDGGEAGDAVHTDSRPDTLPPHEGGGFIDAADLCTPAVRTARLSDMVKATITLPNHGATLDLLGDGFGLTLGEAETKLCASSDRGDEFGDGTRVAAFGDSDELAFDYDPVTGRVIFVNLNVGYLGTLSAKSPDGAHTYVIGVGTQIQKDGGPFTLNVGWDPTDAGFAAQVDELYRAVIHTYASSVTLPAATVTCIADKTCAVRHIAKLAYVQIPVVGFAVWIFDRDAVQPTPSIPMQLDLDLVR